MGYSKVPDGHGEYSGGGGLIDESNRKERIFDQGEQGLQLTEVYATNPADPESDPLTVGLDPESRRAPRVWRDASTARGTT